jgi:dolichyl-phosphate-mannose-protein mannosyltransferase
MASLRTQSGAGAPRDSRGPALPLVLGLLAAFLLSQYAYAWSVPFINDDFIFLDKTRLASFLSLWEPKALAFHWYRPWSREFHYWALQHLFGARELPFHLASFALGLAVLATYYGLVRRLAGGTTAAIATAGVTALAAWGVPLVWVAGVQELWLLLFSLAFLFAVARGARWLALLTLALALMSKETAAVLPAIAVLYRILVERKGFGDAMRWVAPLAVLLVAWAAFHPVLGGRWFHPISAPLEPAPRSPLGPMLDFHRHRGAFVLRTLAVPFNLDTAAVPEHGWPRALWPAALGGLLLAGLVLAGRWGGRGPLAGARGIGFGLGWAVVGWAPLMMPTLGWHAYYGLLGAFGAWLAVALTLSRWPGPAAVLVAALALLRGARADTASGDWGSEWYQRRAASFILVMRADLQRQFPTLPSHSRLFFVRVPSNVGFIAGDGPSVRVWYRDSTLRADFYPNYRPRVAGEPRGPDLFFRFDTTGRWVQVRSGPEEVAAARLENPRWLKDHEVLASTFAAAGDWRAAASEYEKLANAESLRVDFAYNAGVCHEALRDSSRAAAWYARAAALPGADLEARETAARFARRHGEPTARRGSP